MRWVLFFFIIGCSSVPIKNETFYGTKGKDGAVIIQTLIPGTQDISEADWLNIFYSEPLVCSSVNTFGDIKSSIEKLCSICNCCTYEAKAQMEAFFKNIQQSVPSQ